MTDDTRLAHLEREHIELVLRRFDRADAWELGSSIADRAIAGDLPVAIDVRTPAGILFHASMPGATADNDVWVAKKAAAAQRFETSSALLEARVENGGRDMYEAGWLDPAVYAIAGGAVPVRVAGVGVVAIATVSGLPSADDHDLVVESIRALGLLAD
nr:heme-degrading domain-containing protein [uncultured Microbacterium sp.]